MHIFNDVILRKYDVRGIYGKDLNENDAYYFGLSYAIYCLKNKELGYKEYVYNECEKEYDYEDVKKRYDKNDVKKKYDDIKNVKKYEDNAGYGEYQLKIVVGYDGRLSSPALHKELIKGLLDGGIDVVDIGLVPSPMVCFASNYLNAIACVAVTASHNPKEYNGFKFDYKNRPFFDNQIKHLSEICKNCHSVIEINKPKGNYSQFDIKDIYLNYLINHFNIKDNIKILFDCGNGATGNIVKELCYRLKREKKITADAIFTEIDGNFPNHHPDPTVKKNTEILSKKVVEGKYDIGIGFDGDGDRIGIIDETGKILYGDQILLIFAKNLLKEKQNCKIITEVKASKVVYDEIKKAGGIAIMSKIGHTYIRDIMEKEKALLGGETSGHIFFVDKNNCVDDGIFAGLKIAEILSNGYKKMSEYLLEIPKTFCTNDLKLEVNENEKFKIVEDVKNQLKNENKNFNDLDGIRIDTQYGWWMLRASNTQNVLVGRCESTTKEGLEQLKQDFTRYLFNNGYKKEIVFDA